MFSLDNLQSSGKKRKRVGRGGAHGGTSGRGHKGQNARSGGPKGRGFEGGQTPLQRRLPKRGFTNARFFKEVSLVNLSTLERAFADGEEVNVDVLTQKGLIKPKKSEQRDFKKGTIVKILGDGKLSKKLTVSAYAFSASAIQAIEEVGGKALIIKEL
ncbi:MAG TPA: 50S ribosomal protein L15 [Candidatus Babeliales bacterium]|jgi:large subunit ribosomal protein L15|nr:50S ribosomal protein L15 [Candidatus Babeliales bacterium]